MASTNHAHIQTQSSDSKELLRAELKAWERAFEKDNGHKPTPADVKANAEISIKYKLYHKSFRTAKPSKREGEKHDRSRAEFVSTVQALKQITPQKRRRDGDIITPYKSTQGNDDVETVGPTPQLNGRMLGLFEGISDQTPLAKRIKPNWGEQLAAARKDSPRSATPHRRSWSGVFEPKYQIHLPPTNLARHCKKLRPSRYHPCDYDSCCSSFINGQSTCLCHTVLPSSYCTTRSISAVAFASLGRNAEKDQGLKRSYQRLSSKPA